MKFFLGLLIILPLFGRADSRSSAEMVVDEGFVHYGYNLKIDGQIPSTPVTCKIQISGKLQVPCDTQKIYPSAALVSDSSKETMYVIYLHFVKGPPVVGCTETMQMSLDFPPKEIRPSSGHVTFFIPDNVRLDITDIQKADPK